MRARNSLGFTLFAATLLVACNSPLGPSSPSTGDSATLTISPETATVQGGSSFQLTAMARDGGGRITRPADVSWFSSNPGVAEVASGGLVQGIAAGETLIYATWGSARAVARITVVGGPKLKPVDEVACGQGVPPSHEADLIIPGGGGCP